MLLNQILQRAQPHGKSGHRWFLAIQFLLILVLCAVECAAQRSPKVITLSACADLFGPTIDDKANLFEVNPLFVLQPQFDADDNLNNLSIFPKYWLEETHPEWTAPKTWPLLSKSEFETLLARLNNIFSIGILVKAGKAGVITNSTAYYLDRYENGYVLHGNVLDDVRFFDLYPFREIKGKVTNKRRFPSQYEVDLYQVQIGELNYFVRHDDYLKIRLGQIQKLPVVGPIKGYCFAGFCNP